MLGWAPGPARHLHAASVAARALPLVVCDTVVLINSCHWKDLWSRAPPLDPCRSPPRGWDLHVPRAAPCC